MRTFATAVVTAALTASVIFGAQAATADPAPAPLVLQENTADNSADREAMDKLVSDLRAQGWHGDPNDGGEVLYPPQR